MNKKEQLLLNNSEKEKDSESLGKTTARFPANYELVYLFASLDMKTGKITRYAV